MAQLALYSAATAATVWAIVLLLPWQPWRNREVLETDGAAPPDYDLSDVTVVIPARNEASVIAATLSALEKQGAGLQVILVDDDSDDATMAIARESGLSGLRIISAQLLPSGWTGKLWAQQQGTEQVKTDLTLLLDADIELAPGMLKSLKCKLEGEKLHFVSLMAVLRLSSFWEKLLMPAFIHFFKMLYPFALANRPDHPMAAAAGGCILLQTEIIRHIGGMAAIRDAVIDDCTLAKKVKSAGYRIWVGLTHGVLSQRPYNSLADIWEMVTRTAYTQLHYSLWLLFACTAMLLLMYWLPLVGLFHFQGLAQLFSGFSVLVMLAVYLPTLRFYALHPCWSLAMPLIAGLYLLMTWTSSIRCWQGERTRWKGRVYENA